MEYQEYIKLGFTRTEMDDYVEFNQTGCGGVILGREVAHKKVVSSELDTPPISTYAIPGVNIARTINDIRCMVERRMDLSPGATMHRTRLKDIVYARHIAVYLAIRFKVCNHQAAADYFGYANHTSSIHAVRTVQNLVDTRDADYAGVIEELTARLEVLFSSRRHGI